MVLVLTVIFSALFFGFIYVMICKRISSKFIKSCLDEPEA